MNSDSAKSTTCTVDQFCGEIFHRSPAWFMTHRETLERALGFPPPISLASRPYTYRRAEIEAWLAIRMDKVRAAAEAASSKWIIPGQKERA